MTRGRCDYACLDQDGEPAADLVVRMSVLVSLYATLFTLLPLVAMSSSPYFLWCQCPPHPTSLGATWAYPSHPTSLGFTCQVRSPPHPRCRPSSRQLAAAARVGERDRGLQGASVGGLLEPRVVPRRGTPDVAALPPVVTRGMPSSPYRPGETWHALPSSLPVVARGMPSPPHLPW